jgi:hypothetical protein
MKTILQELCTRMQIHYGQEALYITDGQSNAICVSIGQADSVSIPYDHIYNLTETWDEIYLLHNHDIDTSNQYNLPWYNFSEADIRGHNLSKKYIGCKYRGLFIVNSVAGRYVFLHRSQS